MRRTGHALLVIAIVGMFVVPAVAHAQGFGDFFPIVPCGTSTTQPCTPCGFLDILENIVRFVTFGVTGPIATLLIIYAGIRFLISAGNTSQVAAARKILTNTVYGVAIILVSWLVIVQLIKTVAPGSNADRWYEFSCPAFLEQAGAVRELPEPRDVPRGGGAIGQLPPVQTCRDMNILASSFNGANSDPTAISPALDEMITCFRRDQVVAALLDNDQEFTYERSNPTCNVTRGFPVCGRCAHSKYSCHYGGRNGADGAEAVDFNANGTVIYYNEERKIITPEGLASLKKSDPEEAAKYKYQANGELGLFKEIIAAAEAQDCQYKLINFEDNHTHVSAVTCDADGRTVGAVRGPASIIDAFAGE